MGRTVGLSVGLLGCLVVQRFHEAVVAGTRGSGAEQTNTQRQSNTAARGKTSRSEDARTRRRCCRELAVGCREVPLKSRYDGY